MLITIYIEGKKYIVKNSKNILEACLSFGFDVPYFCWHPALGSVGSCRQCIVKQSYDGGREHLVMSCMTAVSNNVSIFIMDSEIQEFRKGILELLMINHPHDCPVCEEGGNCHLQDMTVMTGQARRRYRFSKRTHNNQYLGPFINHEMNRCITCYRCVRYYKDYAGGDDLGVFGVHDNIYFGRTTDGMLQNEFSGNLVEICPTGVFTDKTRPGNYARKWDMLFAPSVCHQCSVGCNIIIGERYGKLCRVENRYNSDINGYFLCDRGRFGCDYVNNGNRLKRPIVKRRDGDNNRVELKDSQEAICYVVNALKSNRDIIGIGSARASMESNFALRKLVGESNFYSGVNSCEQERLLLILQILCDSGIYVPSLQEIEDCDAILILGEDLTQTAARVALSVRQAVKGKSYQKAKNRGIFDWQSAAVINFSQNIKHPVFITGIDKTKLDDIATLTYYDSVKNQARFAFAIAHMIDNTAPAVKGFSCELNHKLNVIVQQLITARKPLIVSGSNSGSKELIAAAANIAQALKNCGKKAGIVLVVGDVNSMGLAMIEKKALDDAFIRINNSTKSTSVIILENDLYRHAGITQIKETLGKINYLIILDHQYNVLQEQADIILPVTNFVESDGTVINYASRAQRFFKLCNPGYYDNSVIILESWRWLYSIYDLYANFVRDGNLSLDCVIDEIVSCFPILMGIKNAAPRSSFRVHGQKLAQAPNRYSGRTAISAHIDVHEPSVPKNSETMFTCSMEGSHNVVSSHKQIAFVWAPGWNSPQAWNKFQNEVGGSLFSGNSGVRLLQTVDYNEKRMDWFNVDFELYNNRILQDNNRWIIAPYWHLFGSEETSQKSRCIKECMSNPYVIMNPLDMVRLNIHNNMLLKFVCFDQVFCLPIKISNNLSVGCIGLPMGFPGIPAFFSGMYAQGLQGVRSS